MKNKFVFTGVEIRLSEFLSDSLEFVPKAFIKKQIKSGEVKVNGVKTKEDALLRSGDTVEIFLPALAVQQIEIDIVFEDENVIIVDKPVLCDVENHLVSILSKTRTFIRPVHRLDRNTTGITVLAKTEAAYTSLIEAFKERSIEKKYSALVAGILKPEKAVLTAYLKKDAVKKISVISDKPLPGYDKIMTGYEVTEKYDGYSKLDIVLITGKMHQIRAHTAHIGHPVLGDSKYAPKEVLKNFPYKYQQLRACSIKFQSLKEPLSYLNGKGFSVKPHF